MMAVRVARGTVFQDVRPAGSWFQNYTKAYMIVTPKIKPT